MDCVAGPVEVDVEPGHLLLVGAPAGGLRFALLLREEGIPAVLRLVLRVLDRPVIAPECGELLAEDEGLMYFTAWWRPGRAVEPLVREALARILPDDRLPLTPAVGGYWTRTNDVEIDIVGADRAPIAKELLFVGSVK